MAKPGYAEALSPTNVMLRSGRQWSIGLRIDIEIDGEEGEYFLKAGSPSLCQIIK